jgi:excinuclease UvrABC helicase subunit UvrB
MTINFTNMNTFQTFVEALTDLMTNCYGFMNVSKLPMVMGNDGSINLEYTIKNMKVGSVCIKIDDEFWVSVKFMDGNNTKFEFERLDQLESFVNANDMELSRKYGKVYGIEKLQYETILEFFRAWC